MIILGIKDKEVTIVEHNAVKSPKHYTEGRKYEPKDVIRDWRLNFNLGNAVKYISRAGRKADVLGDLQKAQEYISFEIEAIKEERDKAISPEHFNCKCVTPKSEEKKPESKVGVIELVVPAGTPTEEIIQMAIKKIMGEVAE